MSPSRTWVKLYCEQWLKGTLRQETRQFRGDWADMLALAGELTYGHDGIIQLADGVGLTDEQVAGIFHITKEEWLASKQRAIETDRIAVDENNVIAITNFKKYQSEYERQKPYRLKPHDGQETAHSATLDQYQEELRPKYPHLDMDKERKAFDKWWSEPGRKLKRPKQAFKNWLDRAGKFEKGTPVTSPTKEIPLEDITDGSKYPPLR